MFCWKCGTENNPDVAFCTNCGSSLKTSQSVQPAGHAVMQPMPQYSPQPAKKNSLPIIIGIIVVAAIIIAGIFILPPLFTGDAGNGDEQANVDNTGDTNSTTNSGGFQEDGKLQITLGQPQEAGSGTVGNSGGDVVIEDKKSKLDGLSIKVPSGVYTEDVQFTISEVPLETNFGTDFQPLTPLIRVDNGGVVADGFMELFVPCKVPADSEPTAWYVDESTGEVEGIPVLDATDEGITISVRHFSDILVGAQKTASLKKLGIVNTDFKPGVDDWNFTNRGSTYAPGGHCAGQSMTAMWYYMLRKSGGSLYNKFDNYGWKDYGFKTPTIWQDDVMGYRLATTAQVNLDWSDAKYKDFMASCRRSPKGTWYAFINTMNMTKRPQFVGILRKKPDGTYGGHALVAYKVDTEAGRLYIADPNYPGDTNRYIEYDEATGSFKPYSSAPDRDAADAGDYYSYSEIMFIGISSFMDLNKLSDYFKDFDGRTVGNATWQSRDLKIFTKVTDADGNEQDVEITDGYKAPAQLKITSFQTPFGNSRIELFLHNAKGDTSLGDFGTEMTINLEPGENYIGVYHKTLINGKLKYYDFVWIKVERNFDYTGEWQGEMTWSTINLPSLTDIIATIPSSEDATAYQSEVDSVTEDYNRIVHDRGKTYSATLQMSLAEGVYQADIVESHDLDGELDSYFAYNLVDDKLVMDETSGSDTIYFTFEQDKTAPQGTDRIIGKLTAYISDNYFSADVVVDFNFERVTP